MTSKRISGHALRGEGAAYSPRGERYYWDTIGGHGAARCECGAQSPIMTSAKNRKIWHWAHKSEVQIR